MTEVARWFFKKERDKVLDAFERQDLTTYYFNLDSFEWEEACNFLEKEGWKVDAMDFAVWHDNIYDAISAGSSLSWHSLPEWLTFYIDMILEHEGRTPSTAQFDDADLWE